MPGFLEVPEPVGAATPLAQGQPLPRPRDPRALAARSPQAPNTDLSVPGYHFLEPLNLSPLADTWRVRDEQGHEYRALCLHGYVSYDPDLVARLHRLRHPALPPWEAHRSSSNRLVLVTSPRGLPLRQRLEECNAAGQRGIGRPELLGYLRSAAQALDALHERFELQHLALSPRTLVVAPEGVWLEDFGLVPLVWLPAGHSAFGLNPRYAAPELADGQVSDCADQYSLALIYAEMLTGYHPRPQRIGSGVYLRPGSPAARSALGREVGRLDLDLVPAHDRPVLSRALDAEPGRRFPSCQALVEALATATPGCRTGSERVRTLAPIISFDQLLGQAPPAGLRLPAGSEVVAELAPRGSELSAVCRLPADRYTVHPDGTWEYRCPARLFPGALPLKLEGFCREWGGRPLHAKAGSVRFRLPLPGGRLWLFRARQPRHLEVEFSSPSSDAGQGRATEVRLLVRADGGHVPCAGGVLEELAPRLFASARSYLQAGAEQRAHDRWPCPHPVRVYPLTGAGVTLPIEGVGRDVSAGGIGLRLRAPLPARKVYLHWYASARLAPFAIRAEVVRMVQARDGNWDIGAAFAWKQPLPLEQDPTPPEQLWL
jgi:hypothetical protein